MKYYDLLNKVKKNIMTKYNGHEDLHWTNNLDINFLDNVRENR